MCFITNFSFLFLPKWVKFPFYIYWGKIWFRSSWFPSFLKNKAEFSALISLIERVAGGFMLISTFDTILCFPFSFHSFNARRCVWKCHSDNSTNVRTSISISDQMERFERFHSASSSELHHFRVILILCFEGVFGEWRQSNRSLILMRFSLNFFDLPQSLTFNVTSFATSTFRNGFTLFIWHFQPSRNPSL